MDKRTFKYAIQGLEEMKEKKKADGVDDREAGSAYKLELFAYNILNKEYYDTLIIDEFIDSKDVNYDGYLIRTIEDLYYLLEFEVNADKYEVLCDYVQEYLDEESKGLYSRVYNDVDKYYNRLGNNGRWLINRFIKKAL